MKNDAIRILDAAKTGRFLLSVHAVGRMRQRSITEADIKACGSTARSCFYQVQQGTWRIEGKDIDGEALTIICGVEDGIILVTIF